MLLQQLHFKASASCWQQLLAWLWSGLLPQLISIIIDSYNAIEKADFLHVFKKASFKSGLANVICLVHPSWINSRAVSRCLFGSCLHGMTVSVVHIVNVISERKRLLAWQSCLSFCAMTTDMAATSGERWFAVILFTEEMPTARNLLKISRVISNSWSTVVRQYPVLDFSAMWYFGSLAKSANFNELILKNELVSAHWGKSIDVVHCLANVGTLLLSGSLTLKYWF